MNDVKRLAGQTAVYGLGTIVPRFLNYVVLTPLFTYTFVDAADYGIVTELYAWMVILLVVLTYGMETGFFRHVNKSDKPTLVYSTTLISLFVTSALFLGLTSIFIDGVSGFFNYSDQKGYIQMFLAIVAIDAFCAIPFVRLRSNNRPVLFSAIKIANVVISVSAVVFLLRVAPAMYEEGNKLVIGWYNPDYLVGYVFAANLIGSIATLLMLLPVIFSVKLRFDLTIWRTIFIYSYPLLIGGIAGTINDVVDKVLLRRLSPPGEGLEIVGLYGGAYKIAVLMAIFVQMFRFAAEPFFFEKAGKKDARESYATVMNYFIITGLALFLFINLYSPVIQYFIGPVYREAIAVVPIVSFAFLLYGVYINLSVWYKVNDLTRFGAYITIAGAIVTIFINILLIPRYSYMASAWAHIVCYVVMLAISWFFGRKYYPVEYRVGNALFYTVIAIAILLSSFYLSARIAGIGYYIIVTALLLGYILIAELRDKFISTIFKREKDIGELVNN